MHKTSNSGALTRRLIRALKKKCECELRGGKTAVRAAGSPPPQDSGLQAFGRLDADKMKCNCSDQAARPTKWPEHNSASSVHEKTKIPRKEEKSCCERRSAPPRGSARACNTVGGLPAFIFQVLFSTARSGADHDPS
jgi:hypothetical protein